MKKAGLLCLVFVILLQISFISAIDLTIKESEISSQAIIGVDKPAIYDLTITNNEAFGDSFEIYSLVGRVDLQPETSFYIQGNTTENIQLEIHPRTTAGYFSFEYKIKNSDNEIQTDNMAINIVNIEDAINVVPEDINPDTETAIVYIENPDGHSFDNLEITLTSAFFTGTEIISLAPNEKKKLEFPISTEDTKGLLAGPYILNAKVKFVGETGETSTLIKFTEQALLDVDESTNGFLIRKQTITKKNNGNTQATVETVIKKNRFSSLFTTFSIAPTNKDSIGFYKYSIFEQTLDPSEELKVVSNTNWWILILILIGGIFITNFSIKNHLNKLKVTKKATFVKTKGGEFALKITIVARAREFVERIRVVDKIPGMVKLYERYGTITPDKVDHKNKRIEWNLENLDKGEERVFSYIIYSKMGIVGKFELPEAKAFYEFQGKPKEIKSNKSFFINEPDKNKPQIQRMVDDLFGFFV